MRKMRVKLLVIFVSAALPGMAQLDISRDLELLSVSKPGMIRDHSDPYSDTALNNRKPLRFRRQGDFYRYNPVSLLFSGTMLFYQNLVSPQLSARCIYSRSCSNYAKAAIHELGLITGIFSAADRLLRCNPGGRAETPDMYLDENGRIRDEPRHDFHY